MSGNSAVFRETDLHPMRQNTVRDNDNYPQSVANWLQIGKAYDIRIASVRHTGKNTHSGSRFDSMVIVATFPPQILSFVPIK